MKNNIKQKSLSEGQSTCDVMLKAAWAAEKAWSALFIYICLMKRWWHRCQQKHSFPHKMDTTGLLSLKANSYISCLCVCFGIHDVKFITSTACECPEGPSKDICVCVHSNSTSLLAFIYLPFQRGNAARSSVSSITFRELKAKFSHSRVA